MKKLKYIASAVLAFLVPTLALAALSTVPLIRNGSTNSEYIIQQGDKVGVGSSTPFAKLSVHANNGETNTTLFAIGSSTATATTTLFSVDNQGTTTVAGQLFAGIGSGNNPAYSFIGQPFYGISEGSSALQFSTASASSGATRFSISSTLFFAAVSTGPEMQNATGASLTSPVFIPDRASATTGFAAGVTGNLNTIIAGNETSRWTSTGYGVSSSSPFATLSVHANNNSTNTTLFAIGSSTAIATSTLFSVTNTGATAVSGLITGNAGFLIPASQGVRVGNIALDFSAAGQVTAGSAGTIGFSSSANGASAGADTALSRSSANVLAVGNGTQGNITGTLLAGTVGIGTSSPFAKLAIHAQNGDLNPWLFAIASSTGTATTTLFGITNTGHMFASSTAPTVSSGSVDGTDQYGRVLGCSSACTVTWAVPYTKVPACVVTAESGSVTNTFSYTPSATSLVVTETGLGTFDYQCRGQ